LIEERRLVEVGVDMSDVVIVTFCNLLKSEASGGPIRLSRRQITAWRSSWKIRPIDATAAVTNVSELAANGELTRHRHTEPLEEPDPTW